MISSCRGGQRGGSGDGKKLTVAKDTLPAKRDWVVPEYRKSLHDIGVIGRLVGDMAYDWRTADEMIVVVIVVAVGC